MPLSIAKFAEYQKREASLTEVRRWLGHIGKQGRGADVLRLSPAHCAPPRFTIAGQYSESGKNYWESPAEFDEAMLKVVLARFAELRDAAVALLESGVSAALIEAESQINAARDAIADAKAK